MNKKIIIAVTALAVIVAGYFVVNRKQDAAAEIEFRYAPVVKGELTRSINATGLIVALTTVDVKSKAGGKILHLFVDEGSVVKKGDPIADIEPSNDCCRDGAERARIPVVEIGALTDLSPHEREELPGR